MATGFAPYEQQPAKGGGPHLRALGSKADDPHFVFIYNRRLAELLEHWQLREHLSDGLVDLLQRLLSPPEDRLDLPGLLRHPWLDLPVDDDGHHGDERQVEQADAASVAAIAPACVRRAAGLGVLAVAGAATAPTCPPSPASACSSSPAAASAAAAAPP